MAIGEAPGLEEDIVGRGFVGRAGKTLDVALCEFSIARADYGRANIIRCRPPLNRKPKAVEIAGCLPLLVESIKQMKPKVLLLVGAVPTSIFMGAGTLTDHLRQSHQSNMIDPSMIKAALKPLADRGISIVPMALAWNGTAPAVRKWSSIGMRQIEMAVGILRSA